MEPITLITGAPGTGKTTVSARLAERSARGVHIPSDVFYTFPAHPTPPHLAAADGQNRAVISAAVQAAASFARRGYEVYLDGIFGPWFLPRIAAERVSISSTLHYVILHASLETALQRIQERSGHPEDEVVRQMHAEFEVCLGKYARHIVETEGRSAADVADRVLRGRERGDFHLESAAIASGS